jgi:hypothetical protein
MDRRNFIKTLAITSSALALSTKSGIDLLAQTNPPVDLVAVMNGEPAAMFQRAITEMGGIEKYIKKGYKVVVKPNIG